MKRILALFFAALLATSALAQTTIRPGGAIFDNATGSFLGFTNMNNGREETLAATIGSGLTATSVVCTNASKALTSTCTSATPSFGATTATSFTPSTTSGIIGTTTNDSAAAGSVGEHVISTVVLASKVNLTAATGANMTSISLTAGDWDVRGIVKFTGGGTTNVVYMQGVITTVSATIPAAVDEIADLSNGVAGIVPFAANDVGLTLPVTRISIASTTPVYAVVRCSFTVSTCQAYGRLSARRVR